MCCYNRAHAPQPPPNDADRSELDDPNDALTASTMRKLASSVNDVRVASAMAGKRERASEKDRRASTAREECECVV